MQPPRRRWPAEWEPHRATWLSWPHNTETWPGSGCLDAVEDAFCEIVRAIVPGEVVEINVDGSEMAGRVHERLVGAGIEAIDRVRFRGVPTDDAWIRDHGGLFVFEQRRVEAPGWRRVLLDFEFDAWGGKYPPWDRDARVAEQMAKISRAPRIAVDRVFEAGAVDGDGEGTILTTEACLLNPNRGRPGHDRSRAGLERMLAETLGARRVLWLGDGIEGDDTDGHVDDLTRFVAPGRVVTIVEADTVDANHRALAENRSRLEAMEDAAGRRLQVIELPTPGVLEGPDGRLPASYANFYFANRAVLVPVFGVAADREALAILERAIEGRPVVPIPSQNLVLGLGAVHCLTQQEPVPASKSVARQPYR
ncbi:MAG: agmatine deiminase [Deltaproteobacteria bacterium]|nr:agmatine deiminase [Deltaproteobacteria bacterium]